MGEIDTFGILVRRQLDHWGHEFALSRDCEYLGHQSKNMLQVLIEHKGEMPGRAQGFKPLEVNQDAMAIELMVTQIARTNMPMAAALRGYYCGSGRKKFERYEQAMEIIARAGMRKLTVRGYLEMVKRGEDRIYGMMRGMEMAA